MFSLATSYPGIEPIVWFLYSIPNVPTAVGFVAMWYFRQRLWPLTLLLGMLSVCLGAVLGSMLGLGDFSLLILIHPAVVAVALGLSLCVTSLKGAYKDVDEGRTR